jgi:hypothetical protein
MSKKLFLFCLLIACAGLFVKVTTDKGVSNQDNKPHAVQYNYHNGDVVSSKPGPRYTGPIVQWNDPSSVNQTHQTDNPVVTFTDGEIDAAGGNARTYYDYLSNGMIQSIAQDPANNLHLFAVFMVDPVGATGFPDRRSRVFYSANGGVLWSYIGDAPAVRGGYPGICVLSNGHELITTHTTDGGAPLIDQNYVDASAGIGSFTELLPPLHRPADNPIWGAVVGTSNVTNTNKFVVVCGEQTADSLFWLVGTILTGGGGGYLGWRTIPWGGTAEAYAIARGSDGRIGIVYTNNTVNHPGFDGDVFYQVSTDAGTTFSAPTTVWHANSATDSLGCVRSCDIKYNGTTPNVMLGVVKIDFNQGYYVQSFSKTLFWSPAINGGNPVTVDTCSNMIGTNPQNDVFFSTCRGNLGMSTDGLVIYATWSRARLDSGSNGNNYFDAYFSWSGDNGATWAPKLQLSNPTGSPLRDCRYACISPSNNATSSTVHNAFITYQYDSIPGSFVQGAAQSLARQRFVNVSLVGAIGIINIGNQVPKTYSLAQNYPNPFNPSTRIRFEIPNSGFVTLKVYDVLGKEVKTLVNQNLTAGVKEVDFDASNFPSGVYFYSVKAGNFTETKKMVLVK